jgi:E3 ubiquitin-protein ligase UBR3
MYISYVIKYDIFFASRINLGISEEELARLEMVSLLCMGDKTHSMLNENMPEKSGTPVQVDLFDKILSETATYNEPRFDHASGNMLQGLYLPKSHIWNEHYEPIHVLLRCVHHRREFQSSI